MAKWPLVWGATESELTASYPSDGTFPHPVMEAYRAVDVKAPSAVVFRWLCQLKVAPYSYDLLNNLGRTSPRTLTPGADALAIGQRFITAFKLVSFVVNEHVTIRVNWLGRCMFGELIISYVVREDTNGRTRLIAKLTLPRARGFGWPRQWFLAWLDLLMMRRQLLNLRDLAEAGTRLEPTAATHLQQRTSATQNRSAPQQRLSS
ncbi:hypothetical protein ACXPWS_29175 [Mycobacterium sp. BMJ-28]